MAGATTAGEEGVVAEGGASEMAVSRKLGGREFFEKVLKSPKYCVAPMVNASELPFRMMCRKYGADMAWTPMFHSKMFLDSEGYRAKQFTTCPEDRPLAVQFCGNDPDTLLGAALLVQDQCDVVDINFGCPQGIAKRGNYGSFVAEDFTKVRALVEALHQHLSIPVSCKIRIFPTVERTLEYARLLEAAGCQLLSVHGRTKENKGKESTPADWNLIKLIRETVSIPVIANGNVLAKEDADRCMVETGVDGVMSAIALLRNPMLFAGVKKPEHEVASEYIDFVRKYPAPLGIVTGHLYKLCGESFKLFPEIREQMTSLDLDGLSALMNRLGELMAEEAETNERGAALAAAAAEAAARAEEKKRKAQSDPTETNEDLGCVMNLFSS